MTDLIYTAEDIPNILFQSSNPFDIPDLDLAMQAEQAIMPILPWGAIARKNAVGVGTWQFYVEDSRFFALYNDCSAFLNTRPHAAVEINYSIFDQTPRAVAVWFTYQKRWLARFWQTKDIRIFCDLNVGNRHADINLLGVPKGWRAYATRGYTRRIEHLAIEAKRAELRAGTSDILFLVVGGDSPVEALCKSRGWLWIPEYIADKRKTGGSDGKK